MPLNSLRAQSPLPDNFNPVASSTVLTLAVQADGKILVGGLFTTLGGPPRSYIGRLNADGTLDSSFNPGAGGNSFPYVNSLAVQPDGKILVGGSFTTLGGQTRNYIGRLNNTGPATQSLSYDGATFTWLRVGTSPAVWRTTFEHSNNGLEWTFLGSGTRIPDGWQMTGVSLPPDGTLRARGHVVGDDNASGWFVETTLSAPWPTRLHLVREGSIVVLSWAGGQGPYQVQQTTDLSQPESWQNLGAPVQSNSISLPVGPGTLFLRIREP